MLLALLIFAAGLSSQRFDDALLILLVLPIAAGAAVYGLRGGLGLGLLVSALGGVWWVESGRHGGVASLASEAAVLLLIGAALGWLADSRERLLRRLAHHEELSLDLIATASFDGYFTRVNPAFTRTLGHSADELMARPLLDFVHPDDRAPTLAAVAEQTQAGREVLNFQNRYRCRDGSYRWLEWSSRPDAEANELVAVAREITERKRLEELEREHRQMLAHAVRERTEELRRRNAELDESRRETLRRLALAAEYRDDETYEHTARIGRSAELLARELGLSQREAELIRDAAPLHDIGKVGVSDTVLLKPARLTEAEFEHVKRHAQTGEKILAGSSSEVLRLAAEIALAHHEWWDGTGYPYGLSGDEIPLPARIVAVVDVFDALTHRRPYKPAWPLPEALEEIQRLRGRQFDPHVVDAFARLDPHALGHLLASVASTCEPPCSHSPSSPASPSQASRVRSLG